MGLKQSSLTPIWNREFLAVVTLDPNLSAVKGEKIIVNAFGELKPKPVDST